MTREWIEAIYDRTLGSVQVAQLNPDQENPKGCWNDTDLNRLEKNTAYCIEWMLEKKIIRSQPELEVKENNYWQKNMVPTKSDIDRIVSNIKQLVDLSRNNPAITDQLPNIYASATQPNYVLANQLEFALDLMHDQPKLPLDYWTVEVANGIIVQVVRDDGVIERINSDTALVAEDEVVTIRGVPYGEFAHYQTFSRWSGTAQDLILLQPDTETQEVTFTMPYRDVSYVANFETHIPRTLTITNGYISVNNDPNAGSGPSSATYYAGDEVMIIATIAPFGMEFYEWQGTEEALPQIIGVTNAEDPSVSKLTMPDCNVSLSAFYRDATGHYLTVNNGNGGGIYKYGTNVYISANVPSHYRFTYWSGNTGYLTDINSSYQSFKMPDNALSFTAHFEYVYSYNEVQIIDGLISVNGENVSQASSLRQTNSYTLVPTPPDNTQGIQYWSVEGAGSVSGNTFTVGDGNAIITGHYNYYRTLTIRNVNNGGGTTTQRKVQGLTWSSISTNSVVNTNYKFAGWYINGTRVSTSTTYSPGTVTGDLEIEARYDYYPTYVITVINLNNNGGTTTYQVVSGNSFSISTNLDGANSALFTNWSGDKSSSSTYISWTVTADATITANYRAKQTYHLTVNNGTGSGDYLERTWVNIAANSPAQGYHFSNWSTSNITEINSRYSTNTSVRTGTGTDCSVTANYVADTPVTPTRQITVITNSGTNTYTVTQGSYVTVYSGTAPDTYEFSNWSRSVGDAEIANPSSSSTKIYARTSDSTINCNYSPIPWFTVTMQDGEIYDSTNWVSSATILRDSLNNIRVRQGAVPYGHQFLQWEIYINGVLQTDTTYVEVYSPLAETTRLSKLRSNCTLKATFYVPDTTRQRTLTVHRKDGSTTQYTRPVGDQITVYASQPDQGWEFYEWTGDLAYASTSALITPIQMTIPSVNIEITETYIEEGARPKVTLHRSGIYGEMKYTTTSIDPDTQEEIITEHWTTDPHDYYVGDEVEIRMTTYPNEYYFGGWSAYAYSSEEDLTNIIDRTASETTFLIMPKVAASFEASLVRKGDVLITLEDGFTGVDQTSATVYEGKKVDIRFAKTDTENIKYTFTRWTVLAGNYTPITSIELWDGGMFNPLIPGTLAEPIYIKMPATAVGLKANYTAAYKLSLTNATIDATGETSGFYNSGTNVAITADTVAGMTFQYWEGDTDTVANIYDPTTTVATVVGTTTLRAVYSTNSERNDIGYTTLSLSSSNVVASTDVTVVSGTLQVGFILTDSMGHIYVVTSITNGACTIVRLTRIYRGGNIYG